MADLPETPQTPSPLRLGDQHFRQFMDNSPLLAWIKDENLGWQYMNASFEKHRGIKEGEALGKTYEEILPGEFAQRTHVVDCKVREQQKAIEQIEDHPDASGKMHKWLVTRFPIDGPDGEVWIAGTAFDITERTELESEKQLTDFGLEHSASPFFMVDAEARILRVNEAACFHSGYPKKELYQMTVQDLNVDLPKEAWIKYWQNLKKKKFLRFESHHKRKNGHIIPIEIEANYVEFEGKAYSFAFIRNISERKEWEENREQLNAELEQRIEELQKQRAETLALNEENRLTGFIVEHASIAYFLVDQDAHILRVNKAACLQTGHTQEELTGMTIQDLNPQSTEASWAAHWESLSKEQWTRFEATHRGKDGTLIPVEIQSNYVEFEGKAYSVGFVRDVSELYKTRKLERENRLSGFGLQHAAVAFFLSDDEGNVVRVNKAACQQNGFTEEEFLQMKIPDFVPDISMEMWKEQWEKLKEKKFVRFESRHLRKDGTVFPVEIERNYVEFEGKGHNFAFVRDISDRKKWEEERQNQQKELEKSVDERTQALQAQRQEALELAQENELVRFALENASVAFFLVNKDAKILRVNTEASKQTGYSCKELLGMHVYDLDPDFPKEAWPEHWQDLEKHKFLRFETQHLHKDQVYVAKEVEANYVEFEGEGYNIAFVRDISERRKWIEKKETLQGELEKRVEELSRSNEELDRFAYAASHDLKSPLLNIHFLLDLIREDTGNQLPEPIADNFDKLQRTVTRMETLLESLLSYSRVGQAEDIPSQLDLLHLLNEVTGMLVLPPSVAVIISDDLPNVIAPRGAMIRIFSNLINNALKHAEQYNLQIDITWQDQGDHYAFTVGDNGVGIPQNYHERIFKMFESLHPHTKSGGTGMGLSLVKKTLDHHGGTITLDSAPGKGSRFTFTWPKSHPKPH